MDKSVYASRLSQMGNPELSELMKLIGRDDIISFAGGIPDEEIFPFDELKEIVNKLMNKMGNDIFQYSSTDGSEKLKNYIRSYLGKRKSIDLEQDDIIITTGSQQGLDLVSKLLINPGDKVATTEPSYVGGIGAIKSYEADLIGIRTDQEGLRIDLLRKQLEELAEKSKTLKFIYIVADHSNPAGITLSLKRRKKLIKLAEEYNFYILEDGPYTELSYYNDPLPTLKSLDKNNKVIYLGTFSKFFIPGFRIAWICAEKEFIQKLSLAKQNADLASNTIGQEVLTWAGETGLIEKQIKKVKPHYRKRLEKMQESLEKYFPDDTSWVKPGGGFFFWVKLPAAIKSRNLFKIAIKNKVAFVTGNSFFTDYDKGDQYMRISFSNSKPEEIEQGISVLGKLIEENC